MTQALASSYEPLEKQELGRWLQQFRLALQSFYKTKGYHENVAIQDYTTQIYWNILELQHRRLEAQGIELDFTSLREKYTAAGPLQWTSYFDGKYEISEVTEEIAATRYYRRQGQEIYKKKSNQLAYYTLLNAKSQGENQIICPNCGHVTTRENLLDGCDYCHSKFTIEDLGRRISNFALRSDWALTHTKYNNDKEELSHWLDLIVGALGGVVGFVLSIIILPFLSMGFLTKLGLCGVTILVCALLAISVLHGLLGAFLQATSIDIGQALGGQSTGRINVAEALAKDLYAQQEMTEDVREKDTLSPQIAAQIKAVDQLFSLNGFLSNVQNKLSFIIYAQNKQQINALSNCDLSKFLDIYRDVFECDVLTLQLTAYQRRAELQQATAVAKLHLVARNAVGHIVEREEKVELQLVKSIACTTQAVRGPEVLRCKGCGATLSLLEGKGCSYCGRELKLVDYDWAVSGYNILESKILITRV